MQVCITPQDGYHIHQLRTYHKGERGREACGQMVSSSAQGFGHRGIEGKIIAAQYTREHIIAAKRIIVRQNEELRRTISNRDKMYSVIAHDLRSPMASIRMVLNLAVNVVSPETVGEEIFGLLDKANRESEETHDLLDNLLKWTKSQTGRLNVVYQDIDLDDIIPGAVDIFMMIAEMKKIDLKYIPADEKLTVHGDNDMIKTIIRNFLSNAIKFTPEGKGIDVYYKREGDFARICVQDHGVGIAADRIDSIFHKGETTYGQVVEEGGGLEL